MSKRDASKERQNKALELLHGQVADLLTSESWRAALALRSKFRRYSMNNLLLISLQLPEASYVAGFKAWQELGRQVRKGEKGIAILAPMVRSKRDAETDEVTGRYVAGFRTAYVFDVSQTDGEELPELERPEPVMDASPEARRLLDQLVDFARGREYGLEFTNDSLRGAMGVWIPSENLIRVRADVAAGQQAKTLAHELAHALGKHEPSVSDRDVQELEAETAAFLVADACGLDTSSYSFRYLASWARDEAGLEKVLAAGSVAVRLADEILAGLTAPTEALEAVAA